MNRALGDAGLLWIPVPRTRGDEPRSGSTSRRSSSCSPHTRG